MRHVQSLCVVKIFYQGEYLKLDYQLLVVLRIDLHILVAVWIDNHPGFAEWIVERVVRMAMYPEIRAMVR